MIRMCLPPPRPGQARAVAHQVYIWRVRRVGVRFLDGPTALQERVAAIVRRHWNRACGLQFVFAQEEDAPVRVTFARGASWSYPGSMAAEMPITRPTMQLGWAINADADELQRVVLHEFGHALGLEHEHTHPGVRIPWDYEAVYAHYRKTNGWDRETVDGQVLTPLAREVARTTSYDRLSIMHYALPAALLTDAAWATGWNRELSAGDRAAVRQWYGPPPEQKTWLPLVHGR